MRSIGSHNSRIASARLEEAAMGDRGLGAVGVGAFELAVAKQHFAFLGAYSPSR